MWWAGSALASGCNRARWSAQHVDNSTTACFRESVMRSSECASRQKDRNGAALCVECCATLLARPTCALLLRRTLWCANPSRLQSDCSHGRSLILHEVQLTKKRLPCTGNAASCTIAAWCIVMLLSAALTSQFRSMKAVVTGQCSHLQPVSLALLLHHGLQLPDLVIHAQQAARVDEEHARVSPIVTIVLHVVQHAVQGLARIDGIEHNACGARHFMAELQLLVSACAHRCM